MNAASHVPSGVLISTVFSPTPCCAEASVAAAAPSPATVNDTKSRRVMSSLLLIYESSAVRDDNPGPLVPDPRSPIPDPRSGYSSQRLDHLVRAIGGDDKPVPGREIRVPDVDVCFGQLLKHG